MYRIFIPAVVLTLGGLALPAHADSRSCQTINGEEVCATSKGNLACQTINGDMKCTGDDVQMTRRKLSAAEMQAPPRVATLPPPHSGTTMYRDDKGHLHVKTGNVDVDVDDNSIPTDE